MSGPLVLTRKQAVAVYCALTDIQKRKTFRELDKEAQEEVCVPCLINKVYEVAQVELPYSKFAKHYKLGGYKKDYTLGGYKFRRV